MNLQRRLARLAERTRIPAVATQPFTTLLDRKALAERAAKLAATRRALYGRTFK